ncbi:MAG: hypothetical protein AB7S70_07580 [Hyphomicrobium sp.]|uniref:hypothetical protein n=1 Tax=Hyphomicrobium sp. TaxID=82 RepID=UPI003D0B5EA3
MGRNALLVLLAAFVMLGGAVLIAQSDRGAPSPGPTETGSRIEAPGTTVETDRDKTRVQAPGVDITIPRDKDGD